MHTDSHHYYETPTTTAPEGWLPVRLVQARCLFAYVLIRVVACLCSFFSFLSFIFLVFSFFRPTFPVIRGLICRYFFLFVTCHSRLSRWRQRGDCKCIGQGARKERGHAEAGHSRWRGNFVFKYYSRTFMSLSNYSEKFWSFLFGKRFVSVWYAIWLLKQAHFVYFICGLVTLLLLRSSSYAVL